MEELKAFLFQEVYLRNLEMTKRAPEIFGANMLMAYASIGEEEGIHKTAKDIMTLALRSLWEQRLAGNHIYVTLLNVHTEGRAADSFDQNKLKGAPRIELSDLVNLNQLL